MEQVSYTPEQEVAWYRKIIRNAAIRVNRKYARWAKEQLALNVVTDGGDETVEFIPSDQAEQAFQNSELLMALETLPERERLVIEKMQTR